MDDRFIATLIIWLHVELMNYSRVTPIFRAEVHILNGRWPHVKQSFRGIVIENIFQIVQCSNMQEYLLQVSVQKSHLCWEMMNFRATP